MCPPKKLRHCSQFYLKYFTDEKVQSEIEYISTYIKGIYYQEINKWT